MEPIGTTGDIIVAALIAVSQLITPVPPEGIEQGEARINASEACKKFDEQKAEYEKLNCEQLKSNRRAYKDDCQPIQDDMEEAEGECSQVKSGLKVLHFKARSIAEYMSLSNEQLLEELNTICFAAQDRVYLKTEEWQTGMLAKRTEIATNLAALKVGGIQTIAEEILKEAADKQFNVSDAYEVLKDICYWKNDRKEIAKRRDFRGGYNYLNHLLNELPKMDQLPELPQASFVYSDQDKRIGEIYETDFVTRQGKRYIGKIHRRRVVEPNEIPPMLGNAFVAVEDKRFWEHNGFDFTSAQRLVNGGTTGVKQGGSTFTMQIIKNVFFDSDVQTERASGGRRTLKRKIKELLAIPFLEKGHSRTQKEKILTYYLNLVSLTPNAQGVLMASIDLFGKNNLWELTIPEMALLAAMPKGASQYNPRRFPDEAKERRNVVLKLMAEQKYITEAEAQRYSEEPIKLFDHTEEEEARIMARYYNGHLMNLFKGIKKKNFYDPRWTMGGLDVKTPFNLALQKISTAALQHGLINYEKSVGRYHYRPWIDERTNANYNIKARVTGKKARPVLEILRNLHAANPYPETGWLIAAKAPQARGKWVVENGESVPVSGGDAGIYSKLKDYDLVTLSKVDGRYQLASGTQVQGAVAIVDVDSGEVLALSGGFTSGSFGKSAQLNRATRKFQPGSSIKPFVYLYALNNGLKPDKLISDGGVTFPRLPLDECNFSYTAKNYGGGGGGTMTMENGIYQSRNHVVLNMFLNLAGISANHGVVEGTGPNIQKLIDTMWRIYDFEVKFGVYPSRDIINAKKYTAPCLPFLLGAQETTPLKLAQGYAAIGNGGLFREAVVLKSVIKDKQPLVNDNTALKRDYVFQYRNALKRGFAQAPEAFGAIDKLKPSAVATVRALMQGVVRQGTAQRIKKWAPFVAGKTGTTNNSKDVWFVGYNNKISIAVHMSYDDTKTYEGLGSSTGGSLALPIFQEIMEAYYQLHPEELENPLPDISETPSKPVQLNFEDLKGN